MAEKTLGIYVMSYKRSDSIITKKILPDAVYVVRKSEEVLYREAGIDKIWAVEDELINDGMKTYYYIIQNAPEDIVFVADDDVKDVMYRLDTNVSIEDNETIIAEIERIAQLMVDLGIGYACTDSTSVPYGYDGEFAFKGTSGALKWVYKDVFKAKPDEKCQWNYDLDLVLQELLKNRIVLKPRYLVSVGIQDVNAGGDSEKKRQQVIDSVHCMKRKWGKYFSYDFKHNKPQINVKR